jgi:hypothetical protein
MKSTLVIGLFGLIFHTALFSQGYTFSDLSSNLPSGNGTALLTNMSWINLNEGWISSGSPFNHDLFDLSFPGVNGWVCGSSVIGRYISATGWVNDQVFPAGNYKGIFMIDIMTGWAVGDARSKLRFSLFPIERCKIPGPICRIYCGRWPYPY